MAMARRAMVTRSPVERSISISRGSGFSLTWEESLISLSVSPLMAETTTTTSCPCSLVRTTRCATFLIRSGFPTDVPPYFCTINTSFLH
jgi:hypothetical protein